MAGSAQYRYKARLQAEAHGRHGEGKRARTRARLKLATLKVLARVGYRGVTTTEIAKEAEVAVGTFYTHFADRRDVIVEVLREFLEGEIRPASPLGDSGDPFQSILAGFREMVPLVRENAVLLRSVFQMKDEDPEVLELWKQVTERWVRHLADAARDCSTGPRVDDRYYRFLGHASSAMVDEVLFRIFVEQFAGLTSIAADDEGLAELLAVLRYRMLFAANPDPAGLAVAAPLATVGIGR